MLDARHPLGVGDEHVSTGGPISARIARHGALGLGGTPARSAPALVVGLSTAEVVVVCGEPLPPRTLVTLELVRPYRPHGDVCRRMTIVGQVKHCERLGRREASRVGALSELRRPAASLVVEVLSKDEGLNSWLADSTAGAGPRLPSARVV